MDALLSRGKYQRYFSSFFLRTTLNGTLMRCIPCWLLLSIWSPTAHAVAFSGWPLRFNPAFFVIWRAYRPDEERGKEEEGRRGEGTGEGVKREGRGKEEECSYVSVSPCFLKYMHTRIRTASGCWCPCSSSRSFPQKAKSTRVPAHWDTDQLVQPLVVCKYYTQKAVRNTVKTYVTNGYG